MTKKPIGQPSSTNNDPVTLSPCHPVTLSPCHPKEPRNPLYLALLAVGLAFVLTALALAFVPVLEQKAIDAGSPPPPSEFRDALREQGWKWLLYEVVALVVLSFATMAWDWRRSLQKGSSSATISDEPPIPP